MLDSIQTFFHAKIRYVKVDFDWSRSGFTLDTLVFVPILLSVSQRFNSFTFSGHKVIIFCLVAHFASHTPTFSVLQLRFNPKNPSLWPRNPLHS